MVWHFYDFSMIYYEFCKIPVLVEKEKTKKKEEDRLGQLWPSSAHARARARRQTGSVAWNIGMCGRAWEGAERWRVRALRRATAARVA